MFNIEKLLEKFSRNINSLESVKVNAISVIKTQTGISLLKEDVEIKDYILYIKSSPAVKNKIFIYKQNIIETMKTSTPTRIVDIK